MVIDYRLLFTTFACNRHMMGKRVDFACRSVISPDPYIGTNEIGIPLHFAKTLTYPTPVTDMNIAEMRVLVERGVDEYPGARFVEFPGGRRVDLSKMDRHKRQALAARLLTHIKKTNVPAMVGRQLRNGDMMLVNRQVGKVLSCLGVSMKEVVQGGDIKSCTTLNTRLVRL